MAIHGVERARDETRARLLSAETVGARDRVSGSALWLLLALVALLGTTIAITGRGAFFDEAIYLLAGKLLVFRGENWHFETWFVGSPFIFPVLAGLIERLGGGLVDVRLLNVGFLLLGVGAVYRIGLELDLPYRWAPVLGAASYGLAGPVLFTGSFATYDMPAQALTLCACWLALHGTARGRRRALPLLKAGACFALGILTNYVVFVFAPVLAALALAPFLPQHEPISPAASLRALTGQHRAVSSSLTLLFAVPAIAVGGYLAVFWVQMRMLFAFSGGHLTSYGATSVALLVQILLYVGPAWFLAACGLVLLRASRQSGLAGTVLLAGSLLMPLYHLLRVDPLATGPGRETESRCPR